MDSIISRRKVPYLDNCTLRRLNKQHGHPAGKQLFCALPRKLNEIQKAWQMTQIFGDQISELCLCGCHDDMTDEVLELVLTKLPNLQYVKLSQSNHNHDPDEWEKEQTVKLLQRIQYRVDAILVFTDNTIIYENEGYVEWWCDILRSFLEKIKRYWKGVTFTFEFFSLQSVMTVVRMLEEFNDEDQFIVRLSVSAQDYYLFLQSQNLEPMSDEEYETACDFVTNSPVISSVVLKPNTFNPEKVDDPRLERLLKRLQNAPCTSTVVTYEFSGYTWTEVHREEFRELGYKPQNDVFGSRLILQPFLLRKDKHEDNQTTKNLFEQQLDEKLDGIYFNSSIKSYRWLMQDCKLNFSKVKHLQLILNYGQTAKFVQEMESIHQFDNLQILAIISYDYQMTGELLQQLVEKFKCTLPSLQAFYFYHNITSQMQKEGVEIFFPYFKYMRDVNYMDIIVPGCKVNYERVYYDLRHLRYLRGIRFQSDVYVPDGARCDQVSLTYLKTIKKLQFQAKLESKLPKLRAIAIQ
eukprot:TRINITY_DN2440_c0_g1_i1.p1 TRINITY_DN2440_c0_g1~~TRINITY_DN2440_c0_g1_i1.p1  ORF type:complete len:521 (+),score=37.17 TRINITY_DN2440_c0_g1_i1:190-1752(+)